MATVSKKAPRKRASSVERTVVYRGIKIAPISGKRSKTAKAIREALQTKSGQLGGRPSYG